MRARLARPGLPILRPRLRNARSCAPSRAGMGRAVAGPVATSLLAWPTALVAGFGVLLGCSGDPAAGTTDAGAPARDSAAPVTDGGPPVDPDAGVDPSLVDVSHARELRAVWVASVWNINFPSRAGLSADAQKAELVSMLETMRALGLNAIVFQVRGEADALYRSELEPWSRFLTGAQGGDPGYDPLAFLIDEAHARAIEVHAWLNPYRAKVSASSATVAPHVTVTMPEHVRAYGSYLWMDPGSAAVQDHTVAVVMDVVRRYDVDGIHFDDYFYPYPDGGEFPDDVTYDAYVSAGGTLDRGDWRRDNVNRLVERLSAEMAAEAPHVRFGISPFGIYRPGMPEGIVGLDQYATIYADPVRWIDEGWLDYVAPQLYWPTTQTAQAYGRLLEWWTDVVRDDAYVFAGNYLSKLGSEPKWSVDEFRAELDLSRALRDAGSLGNIFFHIEPLMENREGIADVFRDEYYQAPALLPPVRAMRDVPVEPPTLSREGTGVVPTHADRGSLRAWVVYHERGGSFVIDRIVPAAEERIELAPGRWAVSAAGVHGVESRGRLVEVP